MASCSSCGTDVGCGCNLINGKCPTCYGKLSISERTVVINIPPPTTPPVSPEFELILNMKQLSKEEKLKRINDILEAGRLNYVNQS